MLSRLMEGKRGLIIGIANDKSLAWGISKILASHGASLAITYLSETFKKRIEPLADSINAKMLIPCDVTDPNSIDDLFEEIKQNWKSIDFIVHAVAFSSKEELKGKYVNTSLENFLHSMHVSCYSFTSIVQKSLGLMNNGSSFLTLSYYGAEKVMPHYNVMGVCKAALEASVKYLACDLGSMNMRVNAISAGPVRTLASSGIGDFYHILKWNKYNSPLKRNTTIEEVGNASLYLLSDLGTGTTGEILHVDSGYNIIGMKAVDAPDISLVENN